MMRFTRLAGVAATLVAAACGGGSMTTSSMSTGGGGGGTPPPGGVFMQSSRFNPAVDTVAVNGTVTWTNNDAVTHTVTYSSGPDSSFNASVSPGSTFQHTFKTAGTYQYYCTIHGTPTSGMHATIVAQ